MSLISAAESRPEPMSWAWLGVVPFFIFALMFLIVPTGFLMVGAFQDPDGHVLPFRPATRDTKIPMCS